MFNKKRIFVRKKTELFDIRKMVISKNPVKIGQFKPGFLKYPFDGITLVNSIKNDL